jgi:hypothetical protein
MNLPFPHGWTGSNARRPKARVFTAVSLITIFFTATSVQAGPVTINHIVQTLTRAQGPVDLRIDTTQNPAGGTKGTTNGGPKGDGPTAPSGDAPKVDGAASAMSVAQDPQNTNVEVIEEGEVVGSICDCGDILIAGGSFPKWPLLLLSAVPLAFIHHCDTCDDIPPGPPTPTPTPPDRQTPTPEPASLLLFGTGLVAAGAGLRRRYAKSKE